MSAEHLRFQKHYRNPVLSVPAHVVPLDNKHHNIRPREHKFQLKSFVLLHRQSLRLSFADTYPATLLAPRANHNEPHHIELSLKRLLQVQ